MKEIRHTPEFSSGKGNSLARIGSSIEDLKTETKELRKKLKYQTAITVAVVILGVLLYLHRG